MKPLLGFALLLMSFFVTADELVAADKETIAELKQYCKNIAEEDGTDGKELNVFLLECVNQELEAEGYLPIKKL
ncbi:hypothetical protein QX776_07195 [Alteromonadaceae bacterium BrNp21-10]|nr:hypothetical protein [Alteromonadaceae bacterium BrNp21-10]